MVTCMKPEALPTIGRVLPTTRLVLSACKTYSLLCHHSQHAQYASSCYARSALLSWEFVDTLLACRCPAEDLDRPHVLVTGFARDGQLGGSACA